MSKPIEIRDLIKAESTRMSWRWMPVVRGAEAKSNVSADFGRLLMEEVACGPGKVLTLTRLFMIMSKRQPGMITRLYLLLVSILATALLMPWFLGQAVCYQTLRAGRALRGVFTRKVTYVKKPQTKNE